MSDTFECNYCGGPCGIPGDLQSRYRLAKSQFGLLPPKGDEEDEWEGTRYSCEEAIAFIERIARAEAKVAALLVQKLEGEIVEGERKAYQYVLDQRKQAIAALEAENGSLQSALTTSIAQTAAWTAQANQLTVANDEKAGRIIQLQEQVRLLREALTQFVDHYGDPFRNARAAIAETEPKL